MGGYHGDGDISGLLVNVDDLYGKTEAGTDIDLPLIQILCTCRCKHRGKQQGSMFQHFHKLLDFNASHIGAPTTLGIIVIYAAVVDSALEP